MGKKAQKEAQSCISALKIIENYNNSHQDSIDIKSNIKTNANTPKTTTSDIDEILQYKKLLDEGIITQEEFDAKKKQIMKI